MESLNLGPSLDGEAGHDHQKAERERGGSRLGQRSRGERRSAEGRNATWDQVSLTPPKRKNQDGRNGGARNMTAVPIQSCSLSSASRPKS